MRRTIHIATAALLVLMPLSCGEDETPVAPRQTGATVSGTLLFPAEVDSVKYFVWLDTDIDPDNGYEKMDSGYDDTQSGISYSFGTTAAGTYFLYASAVRAPASPKAGLTAPANVLWGTWGTPVQITSITPESGPVGTPVTLQGGPVANAVVPKTGTVTFDVRLAFYNPNEFQDDTFYVTVDAVSCNEFTTSSTQNATTLLMPNAGNQGQHQVRIRYRGMQSEGVSWTQEGNGDPSEPNNNLEMAAGISVPNDFVGSFSYGDVEDWYWFSVNSAVTAFIVLDWNTAKDIDMVIVDSGFNLICSALTYDHPEIMNCTLSPGSYFFGVGDISGMDGDPSLVSYRATITLGAIGPQ